MFGNNHGVLRSLSDFEASSSALQLVAYLAVKGIPYEQTIRLAKHRKLVTGRDAPSRLELEKKIFSLLKDSADAELARLIVEAGFVEAVSFAREIEKGEPLQPAAQLYGVDIATVRDGAAKKKEKKSKPNKPENKKADSSS